MSKGIDVLVEDIRSGLVAVKSKAERTCLSKVTLRTRIGLQREIGWDLGKSRRVY